MIKSTSLNLFQANTVLKKNLLGKQSCFLKGAITLKPPYNFSYCITQV